MEEGKKSWGGKRREGQTKTTTSCRVDNDLFDKLQLMPKGKRSIFINQAIRLAFHPEAKQESRNPLK